TFLSQPREGNRDVFHISPVQRLKTARNLRNISSLYDVTQGVFGHSLGHRSHSFVTNRDFRTDPFVTEGRPVGGHARVTSRPLARTRCVDPVAVRRPSRGASTRWRCGSSVAVLRPESGSLPIGEH